jgi:hypothetical protein
MYLRNRLFSIDNVIQGQTDKFTLINFTQQGQIMTHSPEKDSYVVTQWNYETASSLRSRGDNYFYNVLF